MGLQTGKWLPLLLAFLLPCGLHADEVERIRPYTIDDLQEIEVSPQDGQLRAPEQNLPGESTGPQPDAPPQQLVPSGGVTSYAVRHHRVTQDKIGRYQAVVDELEYEYGPYHQVLEEALVNLATAYEEAGDFRSAHDLYDRALHATRINAGLHSLEQVPVLRKLIDALIRSGDMETAVEKQRYFYWLHQRALSQGNVDLVPVLTDMVEWHYKAYLEGTGENPTNHLLDAYSLARSSANIARNSYGLYSMQTARLLEIMNLLDYEFYDRQMPVRVAALRGYDRGVPERAAGGRQRTSYYGVNDYRRSQGESFVQRISDRNRLILGAAFSEYGEESMEYYRSLVQGIDWVLLLGDSTRAIEEYEDVWQRMSAEPELEAGTVSLLGRIERLPALHDDVMDRAERDEFNAELPMAPDVPYLEVTFNISKTGRADEITLSRTNLVNPDDLFRQVRGEMRGAHFRPIVQDGRVIELVNQSRLMTFEGSGLETIDDSPALHPGGIALHTAQTPEPVSPLASEPRDDAEIPETDPQPSEPVEE